MDTIYKCVVPLCLCSLAQKLEVLIILLVFSHVLTSAKSLPNALQKKTLKIQLFC